MNRNQKCNCGSGKKYKKCHLYIEQGWIKESFGWVFPTLENLLKMVKKQ